MIAFRVVPHGPECMRDTRELVLARPTRWRCSPDLESERGGHSAAPPDLLPHPVDRKSVVSGKIVPVRVDLGGRRISQKKQRETHKQTDNNKHMLSNQHI